MKKKTPPRKTAAKKPSPKNAPKKSAPKTAAPKKKTKAKAKPSKKKQLDQIDVMRMDGMKVASHEERDASAADASRHPNYARTLAAVLDAFRASFPSDEDETDEQILDIDPNDFDMDPSPFYEYLEARFGVPQDEDEDYFGGYGGSVRDTVAFLTPRWDGKLRKLR